MIRVLQIFIVTTLALGSQPMQRLAKVWAKNEAQEVWENVRE
jgi:hypothetical protein